MTLQTVQVLSAGPRGGFFIVNPEKFAAVQRDEVLKGAG